MLKKQNLNIVFIGGNTYGSAGPFINFAKLCKLHKIPFCLVTNKERINYPTKRFKTLEIELIKEKFKFIVKKNININFLKKITNKDSIIFSVNCSWILKKDILKYFENRIYNYHNASLPEYRGAACHSWRLMQNNYDTFINIHRIEAKIDTGDIVTRKKIKFPKKCNNLRSSYDYIENKEVKLFENFVFKRHKILKQNKKSFYWPRLNSAKDADINWSWSARDIISFCNAFDRPFGGAFSYINKNKIYFSNVSLVEKNTNFHPFQSGIVFRINRKGYYIATSKGALLVKNIKSKIKIKLGYKFNSINYN